MSRTEILARIRNATGSPPEPTRVSHTTPASLVPSGIDTISHFRTIAEAKGVTVIEVGDLAALPSAIARSLAAQSAHIRANDRTFSSLAWAESGLTIVPGVASPDDTVALSRADAAIAETGTLMLTSGPDNPTALAFLPETHLVAVKRPTIVGTFESALAVLTANVGTKLPRSVNFISGASRTGDIGGRIVQGAHGPRRLVVFII